MLLQRGIALDKLLAMVEALSSLRASVKLCGLMATSGPQAGNKQAVTSAP